MLNDEVDRRNLGAQGIGIDRGKTEDAVNRSDGRIRQFADAMPQLIWISRPGGAIEYLNQRWFEYTGLPRREPFAAADWFAAIHPDDVAAILEAKKRADAVDGPQECEFRIRRHDGIYRWFLERTHWIRDEQGGRVQQIGAATDVDDQKRAERVARFLADASSRLSLVEAEEATLNEIAHLAVPFFADWCAVDLLDEQRQLRRVAVAHAGGISREIQDTLFHRYRLRPDTPHGIFSVIESKRPEYVAEVTDDLLKVAAWNDEHLAALRAFEPKSYMCVPLIGRDGVLGAISFATIGAEGRRYDDGDLKLAVDVAGRAAVALDNARLYDRLRETDRRKDEFLATLAHELRNPLAPIRNSVLILRLKEGNDPDSAWAREVIERQVGHMTRLIDDLLDVSRLTRNKLEPRIERIELAAAIGDAVETVRPLINEFGHELTIDAPEAPVFLNADRTRLGQVFANLLSNAAKYSEQGSRIVLSTVVNPRENFVSIAVKDEGIGIAAEQLPQIFDMFAQFTPSLERTQGGLGIGLALARGLVELHGGTIEAHSAGLGEGSEFIVRLPLAPSPASVGQNGGTSRTGVVGEVRPRTRVLVADDSEDTAESLGRILSMCGHEVHIAHDGAQALTMAGALRPDIAVLDIGLPGMNGYDLARSIRNEPWGRTMTLIAVTGWGQLNDRRRSGKAGFDHHLVKPVEPSALIDLLAKPTALRTPAPTRVAPESRSIE